MSLAIEVYDELIYLTKRIVDTPEVFKILNEYMSNKLQNITEEDKNEEIKFINDTISNKLTNITKEEKNEEIKFINDRINNEDISDVKDALKDLPILISFALLFKKGNDTYLSLFGSLGKKNSRFDTLSMQNTVRDYWDKKITGMVTNTVGHDNFINMEDLSDIDMEELSKKVVEGIMERMAQ